MRYSGKCPKCGSQNIVDNASALTHSPHLGNHMELVIYEKPDALFLKEKKRYTVGAWICTECGFTEFYCL